VGPNSAHIVNIGALFFRGRDSAIGAFGADSSATHFVALFGYSAPKLGGVFICWGVFEIALHPFDDIGLSR